MTTKSPGNHLPATTLVIFGATGNLAGRKLLPALYHLIRADRLPTKYTVVCIVRDDTTVESLIQQTEITLLRQDHDCDSSILELLRSNMRLIKMDSTKQSDYHQLVRLLDDIDQEQGVAHNRLFYLAIPPVIFKTVISCLAEVGLNNGKPGKHHRILVEKPFGVDYQDAQDLVAYIEKYFSEDQVYRIDHYLAKETAQNILIFRFNNPLIDDIWGRQFIDHVQITAAESIGIEGRGAFYEGMGAMRDIVQSHLLQLMALVLMEVPQSLTPSTIHAEKLALLKAVEVIKPNHVDEIAVRGQYKGYRDEVGNKDSIVETFAAFKLEVANSRWGGVPVLLRTGKGLRAKTTEISIVFRDRSRRNIPPNLLKIRIQPDEGISLRLTAKKPGFDEELQPVNMDFQYSNNFDGKQPDAYERVLLDAIAGDQSLFATSDEVLTCWEIIDEILCHWKETKSSLHIYPKGSWGPAKADELAEGFGCEWLSADS